MALDLKPTCNLPQYKRRLQSPAAAPAPSMTHARSCQVTPRVMQLCFIAAVGLTTNTVLPQLRLLPLVSAWLLSLSNVPDRAC